MHCAWLVSGWNVPAGHGAHARSLERVGVLETYVPGAQDCTARHEVCPDWSWKYVTPSHVLHCSAFVDDEKRPAVQSVHTRSFEYEGATDMYVPPEHTVYCVHDSEFATLEKYPEEHGAHTRSVEVVAVIPM